MNRDSIKPNRFFLQPISEQPDTIPDYTPRKTRDEAEKRRRRNNPPHTLRLEQQRDGLIKIRRGLWLAVEAGEIKEFSDCMSPAIYGSSRYHLNAPDNRQQVRYGDIPKLGAEVLALRPGEEEMLERTERSLDTSIAYADHLLTTHLRGGVDSRLELIAGKQIADSAFHLANVANAHITSDPTAGISNHEAQVIGMKTCKNVVQLAGAIGVEIQAYPALTQIYDPLSNLGVEIQRAGPESAIATLLEAA